MSAVLRILLPQVIGRVMLIVLNDALTESRFLPWYLSQNPLLE